MLPLSFHSPKISKSLNNFEDYSLTSINYSILVHAYPRAPTTISIGLIKTFLANVSTFRGNVALKRTVCRSGRILLIIFIICGSKPKSNIRSASSITTYVTLRKFVIFPFDVVRISIRRPGVHTIISAPRFNSLS